MQRIYAINFFAGVAFAGGFAGTAALSLLALVEVSTDAVIDASMGSLAIFSSCESPHLAPQSWANANVSGVSCTSPRVRASVGHSGRSHCGVAGLLRLRLAGSAH